MRTRIEIDTQTFVRFWLVVFGFAAVALLIFIARNALLLLGIAFFLALALSRPVKWLDKKVPGTNRVGATALAFLAVVAVVTVIIFLVIPPVIEQTAKLVDTFPTLLKNAQSQWGGLSDVVQKYNLQPQIDQAVNSFRNSLSSWAATLGQGVITSVGSLMSFFGTSLIVLFITFFMLVEGPTWIDRLWAVYDDKKRMKRHQTLMARMYNVVTGYVTGQVTVSALEALFAGVLTFAISLFMPEVSRNLALPVAAVAFLLSLIPMFGPIAAGLVASLLIALSSLPAAIIYLVCIMIYLQVESNIIVPAVQSKSSNLSPLVILSSVMIGIFMFGLPGAIIAIPVAGCVRILVEEYIKKHRAENEPAAKKLKDKVKEKILELE